jgi:hypothetical protein
MAKQHTSIPVSALGIFLALLISLASMSVPAAASDGKGPDRAGRQIKLMERVIDQVLLDSPNFLVYGRDVTHGLYLAEYGALFVFEASLTNQGWNTVLDLPFLKDLHIDSEDGKITIYRKPTEGDSEDEAEAEYLLRLDESDSLGSDLLEQLKQKKETVEARREDQIAAQSECYAKGKEELIDALIDYGETLAALRDDQWVTIAAFLKNSEFFDERDISHLLIKVKMSDLRAYAGERMTQDALRKAITIEEY